MKTRNAFLIIALLLTGCVTPNPGPDGIPAFRWIDREWGICAGGQPTVAGWYWLSTQNAGTSGQFPGKIIIYPQVHLPLTAVSDLKDVLPKVAAKLADGMFWNNDAEEELLSGEREKGSKGEP